MAELEKGILGRHLDFKFKITENEAIIRSVDTGSKKHDIDLYEETKYYDIDDSKDPAYVTIELLDGNTLIVSMSEKELKVFTETVAGENKTNFLITTLLCVKAFLLLQW